MYLLQSASSDNTLIFIVIGWILGLLIFYYIVREAVYAANKPLYKELRIQSRLKAEELVNAGLSEERVKELIDKAHKDKY